MNEFVMMFSLSFKGLITIEVKRVHFHRTHLRFFFKFYPMFQIRRGKKDNLGIILHITPLKCML